MRFVQKLRRVSQKPNLSQGDVPTPIKRRVLLIIHNPSIKWENGRKLTQILHWNDPDLLVQQFLTDVTQVSHGYANFEIAERIEVDGFPVKGDGFVYDAESYLFRWRSRTGFHQPDRVDYYRLLQEFSVIPKINLGRIDEVWLFAFPYAGYYESVMGGPGAFWCNAPPLDERIGRCQRRFIIMGFNFERGVGEMLENLGHRAESLLSQAYRGKQGDANLWKRFTRYDKTHPGQAECGTVHFAPNSVRDYDWGNPRWVTSFCDDWYNFPQFKKLSRKVNCGEWGNGDIRHHHLWWFHHMPHTTGKTNGIANNWWQYIIDPNHVG